MSLSSYVSLGRSGLRVSPFALGTMTFGQEWGWGADEATSRAVLTRYLDLGGNFIDTANGYTFGHAEQIIGDHVGHDRTLRDRLVIATKFGMNLYPGDPNGGGAGAKSIVRACEQSLRRLRTDYIDLYWMHVPDPATPVEETLRALEHLVASGKVRHIGFSDTPAWKVAQAQTLATLRGWTPLIGVQLEYSLLERTVEAELTPMARELGLGVVAWSPLANGMLSGKYTRANAGQVDGARATQFGIPFGERDRRRRGRPRLGPLTRWGERDTARRTDRGAPGRQRPRARADPVDRGDRSAGRAFRSATPLHRQARGLLGPADPPRHHRQRQDPPLLVGRARQRRRALLSLAAVGARRGFCASGISAMIRHRCHPERSA